MRKRGVILRMIDVSRHRSVKEQTRVCGVACTLMGDTSRGSPVTDHRRDISIGTIRENVESAFSIDLDDDRDWSARCLCGVWVHKYR
jgi:hypothetical protein